MLNPFSALELPVGVEACPFHPARLQQFCAEKEATRQCQRIASQFSSEGVPNMGRHDPGKWMDGRTPRTMVWHERKQWRDPVYPVLQHLGCYRNKECETVSNWVPLTLWDSNAFMGHGSNKRQTTKDSQALPMTQ